MRYEKIRDCIGIALAGFLPLLLAPFQNTPFLDDYCYAWSVEELLRSGRLGVLEYSCNIDVFQILWGALFCLPFGFSFTALRVSTWVLSLSGLCALYLLLRELNVPRRNALIGTAALGLYPIYFLLSFTFMTDVPFVVCQTWMCYAMARAVRARSTGWLWAAALLACAAIWTRTVGAVLPVAMLAALLLHAGGWGRQRGQWLIPFVPLASIGLLLWWHWGHVVVTVDMSDVDNNLSGRLQDLTYVPQMLPELLLADLSFVAGAVGVALLALTSACLSARILLRAAFLFIALALILALPLKPGEPSWMPRGVSDLHDWLRAALRLPEVEPYCMPLAVGETWAAAELGASESNVPGAPSEDREEVPTLSPPGAPKGQEAHWLPCAALVVGWASFAVFLATLFRRCYQPGEAFLAWLLVGHFLLMAILALFYDRYALALISPALVLLLAGAPAFRPAVAVPLVALFGVIAVVGTWDHLRYNAALWEAVDELHRMGVPDSEINGGYTVNAWLQYAHPENAHRDVEGRAVVPWVNEDRAGDLLRYQVANAVGDGWKTLKSFPYTRWLGPSGRIYILTRDEAGPHPPESED